MLGGVGTPKMQKQLLPVDAKLPFEQLIAALASNANEGGASGNGQVVLLLSVPCSALMAKTLAQGSQHMHCPSVVRFCYPSGV